MRRITTWWLMLWHLIQHPTHVEETWTYGPRIFGLHIGVQFRGRWCATCGYLKDLSWKEGQCANR